MTPCRQMQLAMLDVVVNKSAAWNPQKCEWLQKAVSAHIVQWVWAALMRGSLYLLSEVINLCKSCNLPFSLVNNIFMQHHRVRFLSVILFLHVINNSKAFQQVCY